MGCAGTWNDWPGIGLETGVFQFEWLFGSEGAFRERRKDLTNDHTIMIRTATQIIVKMVAAV